MCRRQDLNLHWVNPNQVLNLARLPIPPLRLGRAAFSGPKESSFSLLGSHSGSQGSHDRSRSPSEVVEPREAEFQLVRSQTGGSLGTRDAKSVLLVSGLWRWPSRCLALLFVAIVNHRLELFGVALDGQHDRAFFHAIS